MPQKIKYKDFLINQKYIPENKGDKGYDEFWANQEDLCINGCFVDGVYFSGFLYWHLNVWRTEIENPDKTSSYVPPSLRDNEWIISQAISQAEKEGKGLVIGGSRRISKSTFISSYLGHGITFKEGSQNLLAGTSEKDIKTTQNMLERAMNKIPLHFKWQRIEQLKIQWTYGGRLPDNTRVPFSYFLIRNLAEGKNEEAIAGTKPSKLVIEEAAKADFLRAFAAAAPGFTSPYGWICAPIVIFTGGDVENYNDAKELFENPSAHNFLSFPDEDNPEIEHGLFLGNKYRLEAKVETTLGHYLNIENKKSDLYNIPFFVSHEEKAEKILADSLEAKSKSPDPAIAQKEKMYYPRKAEDMFLNVGTNIYNVEEAQRQIKFIENNNLVGTPIELYIDSNTNKIQHRLSNKKFITEYPLKTQSPDAPIMVWEFPVPDAPRFLYVAGVDPYNQQQAQNSSSLGSVYIYKRRHSITGEGWQDSIVASYTARPANQKDWEEQARLLIMWYNAYANVENEVISFIEYMKYMKSDFAYLCPQPSFIKKVVPNSTVNRKYGTSRVAAKVIDHLHDLSKNYFEEPIHRELDNQGVVISETRGIKRIPDPTLLKEVSGFTDKANVDRLVAFELALALANELDPIIGSAKARAEEDRINALKNIMKKGRRGTFKNVKTNFRRI